MGTVVLNELGSTVDEAVGRSDTAEDTSAGFKNSALMQPLFPTDADATEAQYHDSLQYHFFLPGLFVAGRIFHTRTLQQHSAWMYNVSKGEMIELFAPSYDAMVQKEGEEFLHVESEHLRILDSPDGGTFVAKASGITVSFRQKSAFSWLPAGQVKDAVIHRPDLHCTVEVGGQMLEGTGYSKRYYGLYPRFWGYRFIHGLTLCDEARGEPAQRTCFWTADAAFGDNKYNYFKVLHPSGNLTPAATLRLMGCSMR